MSTSMVSTVLEIEREAEAVLARAKADAERLVTQAEEDRKSASQASLQETQSRIASLESDAGTEREQKVQELTAAGKSALTAVRNISDAAFDSGVRYIMEKLSGK